MTCALASFEDRRAILADVLRKQAPWLQGLESIEGDGPQVWRRACNLGLEGIISKRRGSPYISGKSPVWRKTKCTRYTAATPCEVLQT
jgi:bifunctional non-homologous end joining protein LigD